MKTYHIHSSTFADLVGSPSEAKTGDNFTLSKGILGFEGPGCRGKWNVPIPAGSYKIVGRKSFRGGTQEVAAI